MLTARCIKQKSQEKTRFARRKMRVSIQTAVSILYEGNVKEIILPGHDGEIGIMDFHQPFLYCLRKGYIHIRGIWLSSAGRGQKTELNISIKSGIAKMIANELMLLVEA